ncbi:MAG: fimbrillin family protein [Bacteroidales bacterium]|nr:fimbrillin family protein [Bacteroidales bacterium]
MGRLNNIFATAFVLAAFLACESKSLEQPQPDNTGSSSYIPIEFGVDIVDTRAQIVEGGENATLNSLGVIGYQYANQAGSNWNTAKSTTRPNVFENQPQTLTLNGNYYDIEDNSDPATGEPYSWSGNKYAFFAIYPIPNDVNKDYLQLSDNATPNTPYAIYTLDTSDEANMADVMTSSRMDLTAASRYVTFHMVHRLSAVDVEVHNIYEHSWKIDETTYYENLDIEITDLLLTFTNLHYNSSRIYLDAIGNSVPAASDGYSGKAAYHLILEGTDASVEVPFKYNDDDPNFQLTADKGMSLFFIPQKQDNLEVEVQVKFMKKFRNDMDTSALPDGSYIEKEGSIYLINDNVDYTYDDGGNVTGSANADGYGTEYFYAKKTTAFEQSLDEGYRYYVNLNFTSAAVSINIITAAQWDDKDKIDHEFE